MIDIDIIKFCMCVKLINPNIAMYLTFNKYMTSYILQTFSVYLPNN